MNKTLHKKLTEKHFTAYSPTLAGHNSDSMQNDAPSSFKMGLSHEMHILREAAKELLQPRPQAIARLLKMAREL
jgi:esterase/lipase